MALTQRYVNDAGSGSADGTSEANAMSFATFTDYMVVGGSVNAAAGDVFNIKGAITARTTTTDTWVNGGTATSPVVVRGYNSTIGDLTTLARTNGNGALVTTNYPTISYTTGGISITGAFIVVEALSITSARTSATVTATSQTNDVLVACNITNSGTNAGSACVSLGGSGSTMFNCDLNLTGASGGAAAALVSASCVVDSCRMKVVSTAPCISCSGTNIVAVLFGNTLYASGGAGIATSAVSTMPYIRNNTIVGCTGDGLNFITAGTNLQHVIGNMITDNTGDGIDMVSTGNAVLAAYNRLRDNANSFNNGGDWVTATSYGQASTDTGTTGTTATDYTNFGSNDYSLIATSPATSANYPPYSSIGANQRTQTSATASSHVF